MHIKKPKRLLSLISLSLLGLAHSACVSIHDATICTAAGKVSFGGLCSHLRSQITFELSEKELLDLLDAQPVDRKCVPKGDLPVCADDQTTGDLAIIPARGASIVMTDAQWNAFKTALEQACRLLGQRCTYEMKTLFERDP